jgi:hypothetical protein
MQEIVVCEEFMSILSLSSVCEMVQGIASHGSIFVLHLIAMLRTVRLMVW